MKSHNFFTVGIDGGGTKTNVCLEDFQSGEKIEFNSGAFNINGQSAQRTKETLDIILKKICKNGYLIENCKGVGIGSAGISNPKAAEFINEYFKENAFSCPVKLYGDNQTALAAAFESLHGIILVAGTGSICYGVGNDNIEVRSGGYGHLIDDRGSAYFVGSRILSAAVQSYDKRIPETELEKSVFDYLKISTINDLIAFVYDPKTTKKDIAALSILVERPYDNKDPAAVEIVNESAVGLCSMVKAVSKQLPAEKNLVLGGSVLVNSKNIRGQFIKDINEFDSSLKISITKSDASEGALRLLKSYLKKENML